MSRKTIDYKNHPPRLPLVESLVFYLTLDHFNAPGWLYGVVATIMMLSWIGCIYYICISEQIDIFKDKNGSANR